MALQGILANPYMMKSYAEASLKGNIITKMTAEDAIRHTDELLKQFDS